MAIDSLANGSRSPSQNGAKDPLESSPLLPQVCKPTRACVQLNASLQWQAQRET